MRAGSVIFHLVPEPDFRAQLEAAVYRPATLARDGFVHCAERASVLAVANDYFAGTPGRLLALEIDPARLRAETRFEAPAPIAGGGTSHLAGVTAFPHVYGPIDTGAITRVWRLVASARGFAWPRDGLALAAFLARTA